MNQQIIGFFICVALSLPTIWQADASAAQVAPPYNVIIVSFDALQARHLRAYGYPTATTPNLEKLLSKSYLFKNALSPSTWTVPTHLSIFTSLHPSEHKVVNEQVEVSLDGKPSVPVAATLKSLAPEAVTLAEILKRNGYATAGFTGDTGVSAKHGADSGFDVFYDQKPMGGLANTLPMAIDWLNKNKEKKFFLFWHGYDAHGGYTDPLIGEYDYRYVKKPYKGTYTGHADEHYKLRDQGLLGGALGLSEEDAAFWTAIYDEKIARADQQFGQFLTYLAQNRLLDNSIIVVLSDHGTECFEHGKVGHGHTLYGELLNVLLAIHLPGQEKGKRLGSLVSTLDVAPTILGILGIDDPAVKKMKGIDISPSFSGKDVSRDQFFETDFLTVTHKRGIQTPDGWKMILTMETLTRELYDLNTDSGEKNNLAQKELGMTFLLEQKIYRHLNEMKAAHGPWRVGCPPSFGEKCSSIWKK